MKNLQINTEKLRIVTRCDIHPGAQIAQSNHATAKFAKEHPEKFNNWIEKSEYIALLEIKDEWSLLALADKLRVASCSVIDAAFWYCTRLGT